MRVQRRRHRLMRTHLRRVLSASPRRSVRAAAHAPRRPAARPCPLKVKRATITLAAAALIADVIATTALATAALTAALSAALSSAPPRCLNRRRRLPHRRRTRLPR